MVHGEQIWASRKSRHKRTNSQQNSYLPTIKTASARGWRRIERVALSRYLEFFPAGVIGPLMELMAAARKLPFASPGQPRRC